MLIFLPDRPVGRIGSLVEIKQIRWLRDADSGLSVPLLTGESKSGRDD
jgi:hypothetical protein